MQYSAQHEFDLFFRFLVSHSCDVDGIVYFLHSSGRCEEDQQELIRKSGWIQKVRTQQVNERDGETICEENSEKEQL